MIDPHKNILTIVLIALIVFLIIWFWPIRKPHEYPQNEKHYRSFCVQENLQPMINSLNIYLEHNNNILPMDFLELIEKGNFHRATLICPSQHERLRELDYLDDESIIISNYRLMQPGKPFNNIAIGEVIIKELLGNHHAATVGDEHFKEGYHVIVKSNDSFEIKYIETPDRDDASDSPA